jgi:Family of unknown function (DUF6163)
VSDPLNALDHTANAEAQPAWTMWLILFVRVMAGVSMIKGLYHWSAVCGFGDRPDSSFDTAPVAWQAATIFFAVIDLVAAVGLWLAAAWGGVVWLTAAISMAAVEVFFPQIYGGRAWVIAAEVAAILIYLGLSLGATRERPD